MTDSNTSPGLTFHAETNGILVSVTPQFLEDQSDPRAGKFIWGYQVEIENRRPDTVQLLRRTWRITGSDGRQQHVEGEGVIGEQPMIEPGDSFTYASGAPLSSPFGMMDGFYHMVDGTGRSFDVVIPVFALDSPYAKTARN
jgi:ApaG protein